MNIAVIIPAYNEGPRLQKALEEVLPLYPLTVVVDDGSRDDTALYARQAGAYTLRHTINRGQGAAIQTGVDFAIQKLHADIVVHFDADGQMNPHEIADIIAPLLQNRADIVFGSRFLGKKSNMPLMRRIILRASLVFTWLVSGIPVSDTHCGFRALSREGAQKARFTLDRFAHASQIFDLVRIHRLRFAECPVTITYTQDTYGKGMHLLGGFVVLKDFFKHKFFG